MNKIIKKGIISLLFTISLVVGLGGVKAEEKPVTFDFKIVKCQVLKEEMDKGAAGDPFYALDECVANYMDGLIPDDVITSGGNLNPGDYFILVNNYTSEFNNIGVLILVHQYQLDTFEQLVDSSGLPVYTNYRNTSNPAFGRNYRLWKDAVINNAGEQIEPNQFAIMLESSATTDAQFKQLAPTGEIGFAAMKVKENAPVGQTATISYFPFDRVVLGWGSNAATFYAPVVDVPLVFPNEMNVTIGGGAALSNDASLQELTVKHNTTNYTATKRADSDIYDVYVPNNITSVVINATATNIKANVSATGINTTVNLDTIGNTEHTFTITAQDGTLKTYTVNIYRLNNNANLASLSLSNLTLNFDAGQTVYEINAPYNTTSTVVNATAVATATIASGTGDFALPNLNPTKNTKQIVVNAENCDQQYATVPGNSCTTKTYTINVLRTAANTDNSIRSLTVSADGKTYNAVAKLGTNNEYEAYVPASVISAIVNATATDANAVVSSSGTNAPQSLTTFGNNDHTFSITSESGVVQQYVLHTYRISNIAELENIELTEGLAINFNSSTKTYDITAPYTISATTVTATPKGNATVKSGNGVFALNNVSPQKNTHNIVVEAESCNTKYASVEGNICANSTYTINVTKSAASTNNELQSLKFVSGSNTYTAVLKSGTTDEYDVVVPASITSGNVTATAVDATATVSPEGKSGLQNLNNVGNNDYTFTITSQSGVVKQYTLHTYKLSNVAELQNVVLTNGLTLNFESTTETYNITAPFSVNQTVVTATPKDNAIIKSGNGTVNLTNVNPTPNIHNIVVDAENCKIEYASVLGNTCTSKTYILNITRLNASDDNSVKEIKVTKNTQEYTVTPKTATEYDVVVPNGINEVLLNVTAADATAVVSAEGKNGTQMLNVIGNNDYTFTITSESGVEKEYTIHTYRLNNAAELETLSLTDINLTFEKTQLTYNLSTPYTTKNTTIIATAVTGATIESGTGLFELTEVSPAINTKEIKVNAENCDTKYETVPGNTCTSKTYTINITRVQSSDKTLQDLTIDGTQIYGFESSKTTYAINLPYGTKSIMLNAIPTDQNATIEPNSLGSKTVSSGTILTFEVVAQDGSRQQYTIITTILKNSETKPTSLTIGGEEATWDEGEGKYTVTVDPEKDKITPDEVIAVLPPGAKIEKDPEKTLSTGDNEYKVTVEAEDGTRTEYPITITVPQSSDNTLKTLNSSVGTISPELSKDETNYTLTLPIGTTEFTINAEATSKKANVTGNETYSNKQENDQITVQVTAEDGSQRTYTLTIVIAKSTDASLATLSVDNYTLTPIVLGQSYTIGEVEKQVNQLVVRATPKNQKATVKYQLNSLPETDNNVIDIPEDLGEATIKVIVTAEDGVTKSEQTITYTKVNSKNAFLATLTVSSGTLDPVFEKNNLRYTVSVDSAVDNIDINATAEQADAQIEGIGNKTLQLGQNEFTIKVTAGDKTTIKNYVVIVTRKVNNDKSLKSLTVDGTTIKDFEPTKTSYTVDLPYGSKTAEVQAVPNNDLATIDPNQLGSKTIYNGYVWLFFVKDQEDRTTQYSITFNVLKNSETKPTSLKVDGKDATWDEGTGKYKVELDPEKEIITPDEIEAVLPPGATIEKDPEKPLTTGDNEYKVTIEAEDGTKTEYPIIITIPASTDNTLKTLSSSVGAISPQLSIDEQQEYTLTLPKGTTEFTILAEPTSKKATVTGNEKYLNKIEGDKVTITVTPENGTPRNYVVNIVFEKSNDATLTTLEVVDYTLLPVFNKDVETYDIGNVEDGVDELTINATTTVANATIKYQVGEGTPQTSNIVTLPKELGANSIKVIITSEDNTTNKTYTINYTLVSSVPQKITSVTYGHTIDENYIRTVKLDTTGLDMKNQLDNDNTLLEIWSSDGNSKLDDASKMATGMIVKLVINGEVKDQKTIIIIGDVNRDGKITLPDAVLVVNQFLAVLELDTIQQAAADTSKDNKLGLPDAVRIVNHFLGTVPLY